MVEAVTLSDTLAADFAKAHGRYAPSELVCQPANISGEILGLAAGQRHVGHLGMRIEQEEGQFARTKAWSSRDALERRNVVAASLLVGRNDMARGAPAPGEFAAMLRIRRMRYRGEARNKNQSGEKLDRIEHHPSLSFLDERQNLQNN
jgi:hypothetical protein